MEFNPAQAVRRRGVPLSGHRATAVGVLHWQGVLGNHAVAQLLDGARPRAAINESRQDRGGSAEQALWRLVQRTVTQISPDPLKPDVIGDVLIIGRPERAYSGTMGDHSTAFAAQLDSVRLRLVRRTHSEAISAMDELVHAMVELPGFHYIQQLPEDQGEKFQRAWNHLVAARQALPQPGKPTGERTVLQLQEYVNTYLDVRELIPFPR